MASSEGPRRARSLTLLLVLFLSAAARAEDLDALHLDSTDDEGQTVAALRQRADATVFVFWSAGCPCVRRYQARVDALAAAWASKGVQVVEVSSNAGETLASLKEAARLRSLVRPLWRDEGGRLAKELGARSTPTVVLVRRDGQVLFKGWLDNERQPGEPGREPWLEQALEAFAAGKKAPAKSPTWGCMITRSLSSTVVPQCHVPSHEVAATSPGDSP